MKLVNQQIIKNNNLKTLYHYIHQEPGISRAQLAKLSGLSKTTVSSLVDEMIDRKFIQDTGISEDISTVGRKPNGLQLLQGQHYIVVISWSQKEVHAKLVDICGMIVRETSCILDEPGSYISLSQKLFHELITTDFSRWQLLGICIVVPAMINPEQKKIYTTTLSLPSDEHANYLKELKDAFSEYSVGILNDTACAAYAEKVYTKIPYPDFAYINFQHGIGAALFIQNQLLGQATASYTQFGHYSIDPHGKVCSCGNRGCLELMIGENVLKERLLDAGCCAPLLNNEKITYADLSSCALYGDLAAQKVIREMAQEFALALSNLVCIVHPKLIIIGGKGKNLGPLFLDTVTEVLKTIGFRQMLDSLKIRYGFLDSTAYFIGAMKYFFDIHYDFTQESNTTFYIG